MLFIIYKKCGCGFCLWLLRMILTNPPPPCMMPQKKIIHCYVFACDATIIMYNDIKVIL